MTIQIEVAVGTENYTLVWGGPRRARATVLPPVATLLPPPCAAHPPPCVSTLDHLMASTSLMVFNTGSSDGKYRVDGDLDISQETHAEACQNCK